MSLINSQRTLGIIFALTILPTYHLQESVESPFQILLERHTNTIILHCRLKANSLLTPNAMFFLNESRLDNLIQLYQNQDNYGVSFMITRDLEGYFTCGNDSFRSSLIALIGWLIFK